MFYFMQHTKHLKKVNWKPYIKREVITITGQRFAYFQTPTQNYIQDTFNELKKYIADNILFLELIRL